MENFNELPDDLPVPTDDGGADHVRSTAVPGLVLPTSGGTGIDLGELGAGRTIVYVYPLTGRPGVELPAGWDEIPGARGCTTEACDFRDHFSDLLAAGASAVWGLSSQSVQYQSELVERLRLPYQMISDIEFAVADALHLPTFAAPGHARLYKRITLVIRDQKVEHVFYPVYPPNTHAQQVLAWLRDNPL